MPDTPQTPAQLHHELATLRQRLHTLEAQLAHSPPDPAAVHHLAALVASSDDAIVSKTLDGVITSWNAGAERLYGYAASEVLGRSIALLFPPDRPTELPQLLQRIARGERVEPYETVRVCKDGRRLPVSLTLSPITDAAGQIIGASAIARDLTDQQQLQAQLQQSEARYRAISELVSDYAYAVQLTPDGQGIVEWVTDAFTRITGYTVAELAVGGGLRQLIHPADWPVVQRRLRALRAGQAGVSEHRIRTKAGAVRWLRDSSTPEWDAAHERIVRVTGAGQDITDQTRAERHLQRLIATTQDAVITIDQQGRIEWFNPAAERIFGYTRAEVQGQNVRLLMPEPYAREHDGYLAHYAQTGERRALGRLRAVAGRRKSGEVFPLELSVTEVGEAGEGHYGAFLRDISEKVHLQQQLLERERLAAIGTTAAKLAHEIGSPLNGMAVATQLLQRRVERQRALLDEKVLATVQGLHGEIGRLGQLLREFRSLSRQQSFEVQPTNVHVLIQEVLAVQRAPYAERGVQIAYTPPAALPLVLADGDKLKQVLLNLCQNAVEAMPEGGTLTLQLHQTGEVVAVEISDTGGGIPAGVEIFEPFVTTKAEGTGLGLAIVRQLMTAHNGTVAYTSAPGQGTTFRLTLPRAAPAPDSVR